LIRDVCSDYETNFQTIWYQHLGAFQGFVSILFDWIVSVVPEFFKKNILI